MFLYYANEESDDVINRFTSIVNQEYLQKYWSSVLQTWQQKYTYYVVAMATLLAPVSLC